jgi:tetratricopeptide (TPR) repeat protein
MMPSRALLRKAFGGTVLLLGLTAIAGDARAFHFAGWSHGASGYENAVEEARDQGEPIVLYFHTTWCKKSIRMNNQYLRAYEVEEFLSNIPRVEINPDRGRAEKALKKKYNITGYPTFLVFVPSANAKPQRIWPFYKKKDWTREEFIGAVKSRIAGQYNREGFGCFNTKRYEDAIKYYEKALDFDPDNAYAHYGMGIVYHTEALNNKDQDLLEEAESSYLKALEIDPEHKASKKELKKLQKTMEKLGLR